MPRGVYDRKKSKRKVALKKKKELNVWQKSAKVSQALHRAAEEFPSLQVVEKVLSAFGTEVTRAKLYDLIVLRP